MTSRTRIITGSVVWTTVIVAACEIYEMNRVLTALFLAVGIASTWVLWRYLGRQGDDPNPHS